MTNPALPTEARSPGFAIAAYAPSDKGTSLKCEGPATGAGVTGPAPSNAKRRRPVSDPGTPGILAVLGALSPNSQPSTLNLMSRSHPSPHFPFVILSLS